MNKTRLGIVGCGDIANDIGRVSRLNRKIKITACVDTNKSKAEQFSKRFRVPRVYTDYQELLNTAELDIVYLAVPHHLHFAMVKEAMEKKLDVLCEKPVTVTTKEAFELCKIAERQLVKIGVNYQYRYDKACYAIAKAAHKGELGIIYYIRCNIPWFRENTYFTESSWRAGKRQSGGGTLITQASHFLDAALWVADSAPAIVTGTSRNRKFKDIEVEDLFMGTVETENGCLIQLCSSMIASPERVPTIEVYGSKATAIYEGHFFPKARFFNRKIKKEKPPVGGIHALAASLEAYRRWIKEDLVYDMPIQKSLEVLATVEALYKAAESGKTEKVDRKYRDYL